MKKLLTPVIIMALVTTVFGQIESKQNPADFIPKGYVLFEKINGDLNKDGIEDCVLIIKGTDSGKIVTDEYRGKLDRNRRGILVLFYQKGQYEVVIKNYDCFSSENEDGGVYYPPELSVEIKKGNLYIHYGHGRYGYWQYTFRFQNSDFELVGYDEGIHRGPIVNMETSINFLTKRKQTKENINEDPAQEPEEEIFKETWTDIKIDNLIKLSEVNDFDELDMNAY